MNYCALILMLLSFLGNLAFGFLLYVAWFVLNNC